jgi:hypothetical protein
MKIGIAGFKYSGKTSLFKLLTGINVSFEKAEVNKGVTKVPDKRINELSTIFEPKKTTFAALELVDIPGIDPGNPNNRKFFEDIRKMEMLMVVLRDFDSDMYPNPMETNDFERDFEAFKDELLLQDMGVIEKRLMSLKKQLKKVKTKEVIEEIAALEKANESLEKSVFLREIDFTEGEENIIKTYGFFTRKIILPVINTGEDKASAEMKYASFSVGAEMEIAELPEEEREEFYKDLGISEPATNKVIRSVYENAGLISFFTVGKDEVRAWTITKGLNAKKSSGKIHSDLEKGFIRAETCAYNDFIEFKDMAKAKADNKVRLEGKEYIVKDGDILNIRFNV